LALKIKEKLREYRTSKIEDEFKLGLRTFRWSTGCPPNVVEFEAASHYNVESNAKLVPG
jgi:hypothetical protein